ncbi:hypothetical protein N9N67_05475 [Bacteriovoracaceae bacterium]|nr:hypothetical protein [Bacteriovoracaceae bacterium]
MEWGAAGAANGDSAPQAEGGFLRQQGNLVYGLHFGGADNAWNNVLTTGDTGGGTAVNGSLVAERNIWDFFIGGDAGMQWGAGLTYGAYKKTDVDDDVKDQTTVGDTVRLRLGVIHGDLQVGLRYGLTNKAGFEDGENDANDITVTGKSDIDLNVAYNFNGMVATLDYMAVSAAADDEAEAFEETYKYNMTTVGVAKVQKINDTARANYKLAYMMSDETNQGFVEDDKDNSTSLAATLGLEVDAKSWLTLRGSVSHNILSTDKVVGDDTEVVTSNDNSTNVATGASLMFGDFQVDGLIGNDGSGTGNASGETGTLRTDSLMGRVSMTYRF